jgi:RND family efflux transporter MFP subunit
VRVKEGDIVKAGQVIATLDDADQKSQVAAAGARVAAARVRAEASRASIDEVKGQLEREKTLVDKGVSGRANLEDLTSRVMAREVAARASDAEVRAVQAEVDNLRVLLVDRTIVAPIDGTVISRPPEVGEVFDAQALIVEIVDFRSLVVETDVPEARLHLIHPGDPCEIVLDAYPDKRYRGKALSIGKRVNRAKATVPVKVEFTDAKENVLPEMAARVSFLAKEISAEAMKELPKHVVPASAVVERAGGKVIFVVDQDKVRMVPITIGVAFGTGFELTNGPAPGTKIVDSPTSELADGKTIKEKGKE